MIKKVPNLITVLTFTLITVLFWIAFGAYRLIVTPASTIEVPQEILEPLDPTLREDLLEDVSSRLYLEEGLINSYIESYQGSIVQETPEEAAQETEDAEGEGLDEEQVAEEIPAGTTPPETEAQGN